MTTKALKKQLMAAIAMVVVAAIALTSSTYAWFVNNNKVVATGVDVTSTSTSPNLYIRKIGDTTIGGTSAEFTAASTNPSKIVPVSTKNAVDFYQEANWVTGASNAEVDTYKAAVEPETGKNAYAVYTVEMGVLNGSMDVYFNTDDAVTTLASNVGTAARFAVKFGDGAYTLYKVAGTASGNGYVTDASAPTTGDYAVGTAGKTAPTAITYATLASHGATAVNNVVIVPSGATSLATIAAGEPVTVTIVVWLEGCDEDCVVGVADNITSAITGNVGFCGVAIVD